MTADAPSSAPFAQDHAVPYLDPKLRSMLAGNDKPVMALDADMRVVFANAPWLEATATDWESACEQHYFELFPIERDRVARIALKMRRACNGKPSKFRIGDDGMPVVRGRTSTPVWHARQHPLLGQDGNVSHVVQILEGLPVTELESDAGLTEANLSEAEGTA